MLDIEISFIFPVLKTIIERERGRDPTLCKFTPEFFASGTYLTQAKISY